MTTFHEIVSVFGLRGTDGTYQTTVEVLSRTRPAITRYNEPVPLANSVIIRCESAAHNDRRAIHTVNTQAFGRPDEADLVDALRTEHAVLLSLAAQLDSRIVRHILFTRMWIESAETIPAVALAPMAVLPAHQRQGIGGKLIRHGLDELRRRGERIVIVVGHPDYYPHFGFSVEKAQFLDSPFPRAAFMAIELSSGALDGIRGRVKYAAAFGL